jgi:hypothetical protein
MIFSENRCTPRIKCGAGFFRIMRYRRNTAIMRLANGNRSAITETK